MKKTLLLTAIAVLFSLPFLPKSTTGVTLAGVLERVEQAKAFMYKMNMKMTMAGFMGPNVPPMDMDMEMTAIISNDFGMKMEAITVAGNTGEETTQTTYIIPDKKIAVTLMW